MRHIVFSLFFLFLTMPVGLNQVVWSHTDVTPQEAKDLIDTHNNVMVVDVREEESEYCDEDPTPPVPPGHIFGALNYPWSSGVLEERYGELPIDGEILVVCRSGHRSNEVAEFLDSKGYLNIYDMTGGMSDWQWETVGCIDSDSDGLNDDLDNCPYSC
jgi:rhodanese-related sulfurtransferase